MVTQQKLVILKVFKNNRRPLSKEEVLSEGRKLLPSLAPATVNRNINSLCQKFELIRVAFQGQKIRYELPAQREHPHFICRICNKVFDLEVPMMLPEIEAPKGFKISGGEIIYSGTCVKCN